MIRCLPVLIALLATSLSSAQSQISQADLLRRVIDLERLTTPPAGEKTAMFSSYDRASKVNAAGQYENWDANGDAGQFIRDEEDGWRVMAEMEGPGAITRIWSANPHGQIRFTLDGAAVIDAPFEDLFNGKLAPFAEPLCYANPNNGGRNCYFPIGYAKSCKVALKDGAPYYQINYATYPAGTAVARFAPELDDDAKAALEEVRTSLTTGLSDKRILGEGRTYSVSEQSVLAKGQSLTAETFKGPGAVRGLYVALSERKIPELYTLHRCVLRIWLDGEETPSVEAPLIDFFGSGFALRPVLSLPIGTDKWTTMLGEHAGESRFLYCYFPMPFRDGAKFSIQNYSDKKIGLMLWAQINRSEPPKDALRFYARFHREDPCKVLDYPILETAGRGRLVGCVLNVDCPRPDWWGEGDDKVWIDGEKFPSYFGTGSEDYLGDAWGLRPHIRALQGVSLTGPYGKASAYRWHIADCIDFATGIRFTIENWQHRKQWDTYYSTVVYWYGEPGARHGFKPLAPEDLEVPGLRIPNSVEIEGHVAGEKWGNVQKQKYASGAELSGEEAAAISENQKVTITIPSKVERTVLLRLRVNPMRTFDKVEVADEKRAIGVVQWNRQSNGTYDVGLVRLKAGDTPLQVSVTKPAALDCWVLVDPPRSGRGPEAEDLKVSAESGARTAIESAALNWSAGAQLTAEFDQPGASIALALPDQKEAGAAALALTITREPQGGTFRVMLDDKPLGNPIDTYADTRRIDRVTLGIRELSKGAHTLKLALAEPHKPGKTLLGVDVVEIWPVRSPYAVECELLPVTGSEKSNHTAQDLGRGYSAGAQMWCRATEPGAWIEFGVPVAASGKYRVSVVYTTSFDYGIVQTWINGKKAGDAFDTFGPLTPGPIRPLGEFDFPAGTFKLKCELVGKSERSPGYYFGIDCVILEPVK